MYWNHIQREKEKETETRKKKRVKLTVHLLSWQPKWYPCSKEI
jgi:hypothetical protein